MQSVYGLVDPTTQGIRYIGVSVDPYNRYAQHLLLLDRKSNQLKAAWILGLREKGLMPGLLIIEKDIADDLALGRERYWILYHLSLGASLTNMVKTSTRKSVPQSKPTPAPKPVNRFPEKPSWISGSEAAKIATRNSSHPVSSDYIRLLANQGKIYSRIKNGREKEYLKSDVDRLVVGKKGRE